jgi:high-affinity iron transporter
VLATYVIGLREGLEAALIVGIIAAFLRQNGRTDALRLVWIGVAIAIGICAAVAIGLQVWSASLPQAQQEGLETIVGIAAVVMVTYMIVWMRRHSRGLKRDIEAAAASALANGTAMALVVMAVMAVFREGFETSVFLLAAFSASTSPIAAGLGAVLGVITAVVVGYGIYRGGVRLNMARFFRITGVVLVFVAAGLVSTALHTAHEAGWINFGQTPVANLSWLVTPGSIPSALLTGVLGIQPQPVVIEVVGYFLYLVPMLLVVLWPVSRQPRAVAKPAEGAGSVASEPAPIGSPNS